MIIDVHEHFCNVKDYLKKLLDSMDKAGIDKTCLSPLPPCFEAPGCDAVMKAAEKYPEKIIPLGYEGISYLLVDDPKLIEDIFHEVGSRIVELFRNYASFQHLGALVLGDDMGFKTQTMLSPTLLRKYVFP